jgi:predicted dehydrogenase
MAKIRVAVLGAGHWAVENHIPVLQSRDDVAVVGICRLGKDEMRKIQDKFDIPFGTENYRELLALAPDGVIVSSQHDLHYEHASKALMRGIHVLCEKPMALRASEAKQLVALTEARNLHLLIAYGWNYTTYTAVAKEYIDKGLLGEIEYVHCHMGSDLRDLFSGEGAWFAENSLVKPEARTWSDPAAGGGYAHGQLTHALGLLFWVTGLDPVEAFAFVKTSKTGVDLYDAVSCRFKNGAIGVFGGAGTIPKGSPTQLDIRISGHNGTLSLDVERPRLEIRLTDGTEFSLPIEDGPGAYSCIKPVHAFIDLIQGREVENCSPGSVGARVVAVLEAALRSSRSGQVEPI